MLTYGRHDKLPSSPHQRVPRNTTMPTHPKLGNHLRNIIQITKILIIAQNRPLQARGQNGMDEFGIKDLSDGIKVHSIESTGISQEGGKVG